ncbi:hypothetical protein ACFSQJ_18620 [Croceitalea marina]|uniref:Uncharacterized protein n=1 Tax=Croceitalea marina TaxID=1775166 RepID=A0ABW5N2B7_9FLAO
MNLRKPLPLALLLVGSLSLSAQSLKNDMVDIAVPNYPENVKPKDITTYMGAFAQTEGAVLPFTETEFQNALNFQDFEKVSGETSVPNLMVMMNGISEKDLDVTFSRSKAKETWSVSILPKESAALGTLIMVKGEGVHYHSYPVLASKDDNDKPVAEVFDFTFKEQDKYLTLLSEDQAKASPYLVQEYLKKRLGDTYLTRVILPDLYDKYDLRVNLKSEKFYYIKDKKTAGLEDETRKMVADLGSLVSSAETLDDLRNNKGQFQPFVDFWNAKLANYDLSDKTEKKVAWGLLMNLYKVSLFTEDFDNAQKYLDKVIACDHKKWATNSAKSLLKRTKESFNQQYNGATSNRKYAPAYEVDSKMKNVNNKMAAKNNNINKADGYVITTEGEKFEGKISIRFSDEEPSAGTMIDLDGDTKAKRAVVTYINEKGKSKNKVFKCKGVKEIVVDDKVFEPVNPKTSLVKVSDNALSGFNLNNTVFMQRLFQSEKVGLYKDLTVSEDYFFTLPGVKKAEKASAEFFASCNDLATKIGNGEFENTAEGQLKIAKAYISDCNN